MTATVFKMCRRQCLLAIVAGLTACGELNSENSMTGYDQISTAEWETVARKRILFGHQSVGENILSGVRTLAAKDSVNLALMELPNATSGRGIVHFKIGKNEYPISKIKDFENVMQSSASQGANVALMKFCYVDIGSDTGAKILADAYTLALDKLSRQFPNVTIVAVTAPLTTLQGGWKAWLKQIVGRAPGGYAENARRQEFNDIVRQRYSRQGHLFDLAKIESQGAARFQYAGGSFEALNPAISSDGGHLNTQGERLVASKLLKFIAKLPG